MRPERCHNFNAPEQAGQTPSGCVWLYCKRLVERPALMSLIVERAATEALPESTRAAILSLCKNAYGEDLTGYLKDIGPGIHLLGWDGPDLVSHLMWIERRLDPGNLPPLRAAYVELVATHPDHQRRGHATALMQQLAEAIDSYDLGALSPAETSLYERLGWERWQGPLLVKGPSGIETAPNEAVMILRLPLTPSALDLKASLAVSWRPGEIW